VPWCTECDRFLSPSTVQADGTCPTCGRTVDAGEVATASAKARAESPEEPLPPIPWHLKLLALAIAVYLSYRLYQGIVWALG
jgi:predicted RNA-binding Zn-ribbon protein involved in translation (DUF1610 family)